MYDQSVPFCVWVDQKGLMVQNCLVYLAVEKKLADSRLRVLILICTHFPVIGYILIFKVFIKRKILLVETV